MDREQNRVKNINNNFCNSFVVDQFVRIVEDDALQVLRGLHECRNVLLREVFRLDVFVGGILFVNTHLLRTVLDSLAAAAVEADSIVFVVWRFGVDEQVGFDEALKFVVVHIDVVAGPHYQMDFLMLAVL